MDILEAVEKFQFQALSSDWIENQWRSDFSCQDRELPTDYALVLEDDDYSVLLNNLTESIQEWMSCGDESFMNPSSHSLTERTEPHPSRRSWQYLINSGVDHKALIAFISSFLKQDAKDLTDDVTRRLALDASRAYFNLLTIPGWAVFNIYNTFLFHQAVEMLKVLNLAQDNVEVKKQPSKGKGRKRNTNDENRYDELAEEGEDTEGVQISGGEKMILIGLLIVIMKDLQKCLDCVSLEREEDSLVRTICTLISVARLERTSGNFLEKPPPKGRTVTYLSYKAYQVLLGLCKEHHGPVDVVVRFICQSLLPHLLISSQDHLLNDRSKVNVRSHIVAFLKIMVDELGPQAYNGVLALTQQLCIRSPEKADLRAKCVQQILTLMNFFPVELFTRCGIWICSLSLADKVKHRVLGVELLLRLISCSGDDGGGEIAVPTVSNIRAGPTEVNSDDENDGSNEARQLQANGTMSISNKFLLSALLDCSFDFSPTVRAKCVSSFSPLILTNTPPLKDVVGGVFISPYKHLKGQITGISLEEPDFFDFRKFFMDRKRTAPKNPLPGGTRIVSLLETLSAEGKVFVRKGAISALCNVCRINPKWITKNRIKIFTKSCVDHSVMVRKMMVQCLTELVLQYPDDDDLIKAWVIGVFPIVSDNEVKTQEKAIENVGFVILDNLVAKHHMTTSLHSVPWKVIKLIRRFQMKNLMRFVCRQWANSKRFGHQQMKILLSHIGTEYELEAWHFIVFISEFTSFLSPETFVEYYIEHIHNHSQVGEIKSQLVLEAIYFNWKDIDRSVMDELVCEKLLVALQTCSLPVTSVPAVTDICHHYDNEKFVAIAKPLITKCETFLANRISSDSPPNVSQPALAQHIFIMGEVAAASRIEVSEETIMLISNLIDDLGFFNPNTKWKGEITSPTKAIAVCTLGKFCLQNQMLAKKLVPVLGTLLAPDTPSCVKISTLTAMTDLFARYATIVDSYLGDMCVCLKDADVKVRMTTLTLMMKLTQEDYVKLKCPHFYYILQMMDDPEPQIQQMVKAFIINTVLTKNPRIMLSEFIQALHFLNDYEGNDGMSLAVTKFAMNPNEKKAFNLAGPENLEKRRQLLRMMVELMVDDYKCRCILNVCSVLFDGVSEDRILLDNRSTPVILDAIYILGTEEMRLNSSKSKTDDGDDDETGQEAQNTNVQDMLLVLLKRMFRDIVLPSIIKFKRKLQELKSPLIQPLMASLRAMMKEFKDSWNEMLSEDAVLAAEIELDMRLVEEREAEERVTPSSPVPALPVAEKDAAGPSKSPRAPSSVSTNIPRELAPSPSPQMASEDEVSSLSAPSLCSVNSNSPAHSSASQSSASRSPASGSATPTAQRSKRKSSLTPSPNSQESSDSAASLSKSPDRKRRNKAKMSVSANDCVPSSKEKKPTKTVPKKEKRKYTPVSPPERRKLKKK